MTEYKTPEYETAEWSRALLHQMNDRSRATVGVPWGTPGATQPWASDQGPSGPVLRCRELDLGPLDASDRKATQQRAARLCHPTTEPDSAFGAHRLLRHRQLERRDRTTTGTGRPRAPNGAFGPGRGPIGGAPIDRYVPRTWRHGLLRSPSRPTGRRSRPVRVGPRIRFGRGQRTLARRTDGSAGQPRRA
jgi:hypothetical protein